MRILTFAASNSSVSINRQIAEYAGQVAGDTIDGAVIEALDIHDYEMPLYQSDREDASGIPQLAHDFLAKIGSANAIIVAFPEHNGAYPAAFKNLFDWCSRVGREVWQSKPTVMLATSDGPGGAGRVLDFAVNAAPHFGGNVVGHLSVPEFSKVFDSDAGKLIDADLDTALRELIGKLSD